ncbi:MAG: hypothetical protein ACLPKE_13780 [Streptosporangiaceae bacterium]
MTHITNERPADSSPAVPSGTEQLAREQAIKQIERKRRYWISTAISFVGLLIVAAIWAIAEYHNAGGWPTQGFSQSSGVRNVWNIWIIYPAIAWVFLEVAGGLGVYLRRPVSESQIKREMERQVHH